MSESSQKNAHHKVPECKLAYKRCLFCLDYSPKPIDIQIVNPEAQNRQKILTLDKFGIEDFGGCCLKKQIYLPIKKSN